MQKWLRHPDFCQIDGSRVGRLFFESASCQYGLWTFCNDNEITVLQPQGHLNKTHIGVRLYITSINSRSFISELAGVEFRIDTESKYGMPSFRFRKYLGVSLSIHLVFDFPKSLSKIFFKGFLIFKFYRVEAYLSDIVLHFLLTKAEFGNKCRYHHHLARCCG